MSDELLNGRVPAAGDGRAPPGAAVSDWKPHGTDSGYQAHIKYKTPPCRSCRAAHAAASYNWRHGRSREARRLELERLRPSPADLDPVDEAWRRLLDLIAGECRRAGLLP